MELTGNIRVADDQDFAKLRELVEAEDIWKLDYEHEDIQVWSKCSHSSDLKMVKIRTAYDDVDMQTLFDVLMDGEYRPLWDAHMIESYTIGFLNPNNDVGYYAMSCPPPIQNRDFVLQRSWLATPQRVSIFNHSVCLRSHPPKKYFVRGISYITGYVIEPLAPSGGAVGGGVVSGCSLAYISLTDPKGAIPLWAINKSTQYFAPKMIKTLHQACLGYAQWKSEHSPGYKPWIFPEQIDLPKLTIDQCIPNGDNCERFPWKDKKQQEASPKKVKL